MGRKIVGMLILAFALSVSCANQVSAYSVYSDGNLSSTYVTYFRDALGHSHDNYVVWRNGQYEYCMVTGDLEISGNQFTAAEEAEELFLYTITTNTGNYNNSRYTYVVTSLSEFSLDAENSLVYSDLGMYPMLEERSDIYENATFILLVILAVCMLIRPIFAFTYRMRCSS